MLGQMCMVAVWCGPGPEGAPPGYAVNSGRPLSARLILQLVPSMRKLRMARTNSASRSLGSSRRRKVSLGSRFDATVAAAISSPLSSTTPRARPSRTSTLATGAFTRVSTPLPRADVAMAQAASQQDVRRPRRARSAISADHAVGGQRDLDFLGLEPFVEELRRALREDLDQRHEIARAQFAHLPGKPQVIDEIAGAQRERRRRGQ